MMAIMLELMSDRFEQLNNHHSDIKKTDGKIQETQMFPAN
jgi:hypothetical protein